MNDANRYRNKDLASLSASSPKYLPLVQAVRAVTGTSPHLSTLLRWCTKGARGRTLAHVIIGGRKMTRIEDVQAFIQFVDARIEQKFPIPNVPKDRAKTIEKAVAELQKIVGN